MKTPKFLISMVAVIMIVTTFYSCQKEPESIVISDETTLMELKNTDAGCVTCINLLANPVQYYPMSQNQTVTWGNGNHNKTIYIQYYNTASDFILRVKSTAGWADLVIDGISSWTNGPVEPNIWANYVVPLPEGWQACDDYNFNLQVVGNGPSADFVVEYDLVGVCPTVTDIDGNIYHTVQIGTQRWMIENLRTTHFNDGEVIPNVTGGADWFSLTTPGYCWYNNNAEYQNPYGALYNYYAVNSGKLAPAGWHVPTLAEWITLRNYAGGTNKGARLAEKGTLHWASPNDYATNQFGFTAVGNGKRANDQAGTYLSMLVSANFWAFELNPNDPTQAWYMSIISRYNLFATSWGGFQFGFGVRCIKD